MDWARAVERNSEALKAIVAALFVKLGGAAARVPLPLHRAVLKVLGPAESAVRRLIVIAARGLGAEPVRSRVMTKVPAGRGGHNRLAFRLFDRRKRLAPRNDKRGPGLEPRIHVIGGDPRVTVFWPPSLPAAVPTAPLADGLVEASRLRLRLEAVSQALGDLPRQARRLVRLRARRQQVASLKHVSPLRPGPPPGHRRRPVHAVDHVLAECHGLARDAMALNTS